MFAGISWGEKRRERQAEADTHRWPSLTNCVPYLEHCIPTWMHDPPEDYISQPPLQLGIWPGYQVPAKGIWTKVTRTTSWSCPQQESSWGSSGREFSSTPGPPPPPSHPTLLFSGERTYGQSWNGHMGSQYGSHVLKTAEKPGLWWLQQSVQPCTFRKHMSHLCPAAKPIS